jgi:hypothetical protein
MADLYVDANRGNDAWPGTLAQPKRTLAAIDPGFNPGAGGGIYLASDSVFDLAITRAANPRVLLTQVNGSEANRARIASYVPTGALGTTKPTIRMRMLPVPSDWTWDSTPNFGHPKGWYIQFAWTTDYWDVWMQCGGQYAVGMNQSTTNNKGYGYINGEMVDSASASIGDFVNGMGLNTLRWNLDYSGTASANARLYLSGLGLRNPAIDPSTVYGPGGIVIGLGVAFSMYGCGNHTVMSDIRTEYGAGLLLFQGATDSRIAGFELTGCETYETTTAMRVNCGANTAAARWQIDVHHNDFQRLSGPAFKAYGKGLAGRFRDNYMRDGNLTLAIAGAVYTQCTPSNFLGYEEPFKVQRNDAGRWLNGTGNCTFDGGCYYADYEDDGTVWEANIARDSYMAYQVGCGLRSRWHANISLNCEYMANWNNAVGLADNDYTMTNSLHVAAKRGTFGHGQGTGVHLAANVMYQAGAAADLVGMRMTNCIIINHPEGDPNEFGTWLGDEAEWIAGKIVCARNLFIGYNATQQVMSDLNSPTNRTSSADCIAIGTDPRFFGAASGDYRIAADSPLIGAGSTAVQLHRGAATFDRRAMQSPPAVGPYEAPTWPSYFARLAA